jgi:hypothetical protein
MPRIEYNCTAMGIFFAASREPEDASPDTAIWPNVRLEMFIGKSLRKGYQARDGHEPEDERFTS